MDIEAEPQYKVETHAFGVNIWYLTVRGYIRRLYYMCVYTKSELYDGHLIMTVVRR